MVFPNPALQKDYRAAREFKEIRINALQ